MVETVEEKEENKTPWFRRNWKEKLFLVVLLASCLFMFNKLNLSPNRWTLHPDDQYVLVFSRVLGETGHLWYQSPHNEAYDVLAFTPGIDDYECDPDKGYEIRTPYAPGIHFLVSPGHLFGFKGPFLIVALLGVVGVLFFYLFVRELFGVLTAMVATVFFALSPAYVYWSNMLFTNVPTMCFFMGGLYFLARTAKHPEKKANYLLATALLIISIWIRGDFIFPVGIVVLAVLIGYRKQLRWRYVLYAFALFIVMGCTIAGVNYVTTGSPVGVVPKVGTGAHATQVLVKYTLATFNLEVLYNNTRAYVYGIAPLMTVLGVLGVLYCARTKERKNPFLIALLLIAAFALVYYGKNACFWGYDKDYLAASYVRYFLPIFMSLTVFAAVFIVKWVRSISTRSLAVAACVLVLLAQVLISVNVLNRNTFGLTYTDALNQASGQVDRFAAELPDESLVVNFSKDDFYKKMIVSRTVFTPAAIPEEERLDRTLEILIDLDRKGVPVYIFNNPDREIVDIEEWDRNSREFHLEPVEHGIHFKVGARDPVIYRFESDLGRP